MIRNFCLLSIVALCLAAPPSASAYWPYLGYGYGGYGYGYGWGMNAATTYRPAPPYFSLYPPVYYSPHITARHYGASPFAWAGGMQPITYVPHPSAASAPEPMMIENPYVTNARPASKQTTVVPTEVQPLKLNNPFVANVGR